MARSDADKMKRDRAETEARKIMERAATGGYEVTYQELAEGIVAQRLAPNGKPMTRLLCRISERTLKNDRGLLSSVVVLSRKQRPGKGYYAVLARLGRIDPDLTALSEDDLKVIWQRERQVVDQIWRETS